MKRKKSSVIATVSIVILILIVAFFMYQEIISRNGGSASAGGSAPAQQARPAAPQGQNAGPGGRNATSVRVTPVVLGSIENSININGDVLASFQVSLYPAVAGKVTETRYQAGDRISQGAVAAMIDPSRAGEVYSQSPVVSTISGTVLSVPVHQGDTVTANTAVMVVGDLSRLVVETYVPERFANSARRDLSAQVFLEALPGEIFQAVVEEVSPVLDPSSRTLKIRLRFSGPADNRIKAGMFATISLVTNTRNDVPVIPRSTLINTYGSWIVFTADERNIAQRREVTLGLESETMVEVTGGLSVGDRVVSAGQNFLTQGELVRIVE